MLSAAQDILKKQGNSSSSDSENGFIGDERHCSPISTGAVLLADIVPAVVIKITGPFFLFRLPYGTRVFAVIVFQIASYLIVAFSFTIPMSLTGVVCASIGSGMGEITFLSLTAHFQPNVVSTWSSGTGAAGLVGAFAYAGITETGVTPQTTLLIMLVVPVIFALSYWFLTVFPGSVHQVEILKPHTWLVPEVLQHQEEEHTGLLDVEPEAQHIPSGFCGKLKLIVPLLKFMVPLGLVYFAEYFINQGLHELVYFPHMWLSQKSQYRWYQVDYQLGVFISRSSVNLLQIPTHFLPLLTLLQFVNAGLFFSEAYLAFMKGIWWIFALIFWEGLLGGAAYVNTFYQIRKQVRTEVREFSLGVASMADSTGILFAGLSAIPVHNWICAHSASH